jgi:hypothetical protein
VSSITAVGLRIRLRKIMAQVMVHNCVKSRGSTVTQNFYNIIHLRCFIPRIPCRPMPRLAICKTHICTCSNRDDQLSIEILSRNSTDSNELSNHLYSSCPCAVLDLLPYASSPFRPYLHCWGGTLSLFFASLNLESSYFAHCCQDTSLKKV